MPPNTQTIHGGYRAPDEEHRERIAAWLEANGIDPCQVCATRPVYVLAVPNGTMMAGRPWIIDVIVFHQYYENPDGRRERNLISGEAVAFQRTVPLNVPFPDGPTTDGEAHGEADQQAAQQAPQVQVRDARKAGVPHRHEGEGSQRPRQGQSVRNEGSTEEGSSRSDEALSQSEEDRRQEEVGDQ
jgi:hypothetical protein